MCVTCPVMYVTCPVMCVTCPQNKKAISLKGFWYKHLYFDKHQYMDVCDRLFDKQRIHIQLVMSC